MFLPIMVSSAYIDRDATRNRTCYPYKLRGVLAAFLAPLLVLSLHLLEPACGV
jgi:hypothetical protein